jgi:hypothetical protein
MLSKKVFKEKKSIKGELLKALETNSSITASQIAKNVGISIYRVKKYCKNHNIDLDNYSKEAITLKSKPIVETKKRKNPKSIELKEQQDTKIKLTPPSMVKINL